MTYAELLASINAKLTRVGNDRVTDDDIREVCTDLLNMINQVDVQDNIPDWTNVLIFNTDGSGDGKYCKYPDTNGEKRLFETKTSANSNNPPPTDPLIVETTHWKEISASSGSALSEWQPGVYGLGLIIVYHNHSINGRNLYVLNEATRPFTSSNIETELTAGKWRRIGVANLGEVLQIGNSAQGSEIVMLGAPGQPTSAARLQDVMDAQDAAQDYADAAVAAAVEGLKWKDAVRVATTGNISLSGTQTIDGIAVIVGNRVLVKAQTDQIQNGIYIVAAGAWSRAIDANSATELEAATVFVQEGTSNANTSWTQTTDSINLGVSNIVWTAFGSSVPNASTTVAGTVEKATQSEVDAGTSVGGSGAQLFVGPAELQAGYFKKDGSAFGTPVALGLTDNFSLTIQTAAASLIFRTNANDRLRILSDGKIIANRATAIGSEDILFKGTGTTTGLALRIVSSIETDAFTFSHNGILRIGAQGAQITSASGGVANIQGRGMLIAGGIDSQGSDALTINFGSMGGINFDYTSLKIIQTFAPTGAVTPPTYTGIRIIATINQTSGSNGYVACLDYNPVMTSILGPEYGFIVRRPQAKSAFGLGPSGNVTPTAPTARIDIIGATADADKDFAPLRLRAGVDVTSPNEGDVWHVTTNNRLRFYTNSVKYDIPMSDLTTGAAAAAAGTIKIRLNGVDYNLLHT